MGSDGAMTLLEAVGSYVDSMKKKESQQIAHQQLFRFVSWCGRDRALSEIRPSEIEDYVERAGGAGMSFQAAERLQVIRRFLAYARKKGMMDVNLAQHVRIPRAKARTIRERLAKGGQTVELTRHGHAQLAAELEKLESERGPLAAQIGRAAADKDVRENAPLEAAREQMGQAEARIRHIEETLKVAVIIGRGAKRKDQKIVLGANVVVQDVGSGRRTTYTIVNAMEANPSGGKISDASPVGKALVGHSMGDEIAVDTPGGKQQYRIVKVTS